MIYGVFFYRIEHFEKHSLQVNGRELRIHDVKRQVMASKLLILYLTLNIPEKCRKNGTGDNPEPLSYNPRDMRTVIGRLDVARGRIGVAEPDTPNVINRQISDLQARITVEENHGPCKSLVVDGAWNVPAAERPAGWEKWPVREL